ncbi:tripartite tricarboxylate transporter permease [Photobacterium sp. ZSDE20]|uniref:Tripartite tricarboxylate transporter permease n=1 Tax=Photobacterium pectinilyticum TaxID=2906793 RepID=A0ABT1N5P8_9GAMM|nr:tripartite tricarboxylate transporter permease [Photobacterium sp. ZSDE20]MCQ1059051.1 tripartite tricarboxylate transporter permease [Photobacterium sp. ZSDE20]MDD1824206.1 tripartite tricarboxylate transporter permease [Photobacterium sp. ZSDE20]
MDTLTLLLGGLNNALTFHNLLAAAAGALLGLMVGAMPGIGSLAGVALLLPITFQFEPVTGIIMLSAVYYSNMYGGSYSAILLNIPGDSPAVMTSLDGYPMAQKGRPGKALFTSNISSFIGGTVGIIFLTLLGPAMARFGLRFGPVEMAALLMVAMTSLSWLMGDSPTKGVITTLIGIMLATVGFDIVVGTPRYHFDSLYFLGGVPFIPLVIGMFGFSQVMDLMEKKDQKVEFDKKLTLKDSILSASEIKRIVPTSLRSSLLGTSVGVLPGAGATTGSFLGYIAEKKLGKNQKEMGKGAIEGVAAAEAANNSAAASAFAPLLSLGIPGSGTGAVLLGGLLMYGLNPGPLLFTNEPEFTWSLIASLYLANIITLLVALSIIPFLVKILKVPVNILIPIISSICVVGAYCASNSFFGVFVMLAAGVVGYFLKKNDYPIAPLLLAFVLAPTLETNIRRSFLMSEGSPMIFFEKPISAVLMTFLLITIITPMIRKYLKRRKEKLSVV